MSVPANGDFSMFGYFNNTTIQGAIAQGGGSVNGDTEFTELIAASTTSRFHPASNIINGNPTAITNLYQVNNALQYRRYPTFTISLCHDSTDSDGACDCDHGSATYYVFGGSTSSSNEVTQFAQAHTITNSNGTTPSSGFYSNGGIYRFWNNAVGAFGDDTGVSIQIGSNLNNGDCGDRRTVLYL